MHDKGSDFDGGPLGSAITPQLIAEKVSTPAPDEETRSYRVPEAKLHTELDCLLAAGAERDGVWLFAYGSLLWENTVGADERREARVYGLHRRFCLWQWDYRGTLPNPCLMLALDHGGSCTGAVYRIAGPDLYDKVWPTFHMEMHGDAYRARWVKAAISQGVVRALVFVINRDGPRYAGHLPDPAVADRIAHGCGSKGACADYLRRTVDALRQSGIRDSHLFRLDEMVAERLERLTV